MPPAAHQGSRRELRSWPWPRPLEPGMVGGHMSLGQVMVWEQHRPRASVLRGQERTRRHEEGSGEDAQARGGVRRGCQEMQPPAQCLDAPVPPSRPRAAAQPSIPEAAWASCPSSRCVSRLQTREQCPAFPKWGRAQTGLPPHLQGLGTYLGGLLGVLPTQAVYAHEERLNVGVRLKEKRLLLPTLPPGPEGRGASGPRPARTPSQRLPGTPRTRGVGAGQRHLLGDQGWR